MVQGILSLIIVFGFHRVCSEVYNFSINNALNTVIVKKRKKYITIAVLFIASGALVAWFCTIAIVQPEKQKNI